MKKVFMFFVVVMFLAGAAEAGVLNIVDGNDIKEIVNAAEPSIAIGQSFVKKESVKTATISLITYSNRDLALGSLRGGYAGKELDQPESIIGALEIIAPNIARRFIPDTLKDWKANFKVLTLLPSASIYGGRVINDEETDKKWDFGATIGSKVTF